MSNNGCGQLGAIQTRGTCWFYSILNGFILSEDGQKILYNRLTNFYKKLKPDEKAYFDDQLNAPCPMKNLSKTKEIYFWKFIDQYLCFMSGPRAVSLKAGKSASILGGISLQGTFAKEAQGGKGAFPQVEIGKILDHVGFAKDYYVKYANDPPKFHAGRKPQFVVVMQDKYYPKTFMDKIPKGLLADPKYELMCASLVIGNTNANKAEMHKMHGIAGFVCNGKGYIYDSNQRKVFKCNWWNLTDFKKVANEEVAEAYPFFKGVQINVQQYAFAIFARKEFTKDIGVSCLMKYRIKTPETKINFTDPNAGNRINSKLYNYLKPAQRIALKRKWARTEHKVPIYINKATFNSIVAGAKTRRNASQQVLNLESAGYKWKPENYNEYAAKLSEKFTIKKASPKAPVYINKATFNSIVAGAKNMNNAYNQFRNLELAGYKYKPVNYNEYVAKLKAKFQIKKASPKPKTPSPSPRTKRATKVRANFEKYWKDIQPENRQLIRNYVSAYKSPSPEKPPPYTITNAKRNVNALKTAKARAEFYKKGTVGKGLNPTNLIELSKYIKAKNLAARNARAAKKSVAK